MITGAQAYQSGGDVVTAILAVLTAAMLLVKDGKFLAGLCALAFIGQMNTGCGSSIPTPEVAKIGVGAACIAIEASGCFEDVQGAFPGLNAATCTSVLFDAVNVAIEVQKNFETLPKEEAAANSVDPILSIAEKVNAENWDPLKVSPESIRPNSSCRKVARNLGVK